MVTFFLTFYTLPCLNLILVAYFAFVFVILLLCISSCTVNLGAWRNAQVKQPMYQLKIFYSVEAFKFYHTIWALILLFSSSEGGFSLSEGNFLFILHKVMLTVVDLVWICGWHLMLPLSNFLLCFCVLNFWFYWAIRQAHQFPLFLFGNM